MTVIWIAPPLVLLIILLFILVRYSKVVDQYEEEVRDLQLKNLEIVNFLERLYMRLLEDNIKLTEVDKGGSFRSDDEVGFAFDSIRSIIQDLVIYVEKNINSLQEDGEKTEER
jgi:hypothetical protein